MRLFGGISLPLGRRARAGVSANGTPWAGARAGAGGVYVGIRSGSSRPQAYAARGGEPCLVFEVDDRGRVFLGSTELDREDLRAVLAASDTANEGSTMNGAALIAAERERQIAEEGWTPEHDDGHDESELAIAAACYAVPEYMRTSHHLRWPWDGYWKPTPDDRERELVKAGALIAADIDRLQRLASAGNRLARASMVTVLPDSKVEAEPEDRYVEEEGLDPGCRIDKVTGEQVYSSRWL